MRKIVTEEGKEGRKADVLEPHKISITHPTEKTPYFQITWREGGKRKNTSAKTREAAMAEAEKIADRLELRAPRAVDSVSDLMDAYLSPDRTTKKPWSTSHRANLTRLSKLYIVPAIGTIRCEDVTRDDLRRAMESTPTDGEAQRVRSALSGALRFAEAAGYLVLPSSRLMSENYPTPKMKSPKGKPTKAGWDGAVKEQGASNIYIGEDEIPTLDDVYRLAAAAGALEGCPWWYELWVIFAAFTGMRIGEMIGLRAAKVALTEEKRRVLVDTQWLEKSSCFAPPKRGTTRVVAFRAVTPPGEVYPEGYPLAEKLAKRLAEVAAAEKRHAEEIALHAQVEEGKRPWHPGTFDAGLLFPAPKGGTWTQSNLSRRMLHPAEKAAEWPTYADGEYRWSWHSLRHFFCSYLLSEGVPAKAIMNAAGHKSVATTLNLYVKSSKEDVELLEAL